MIIVKQETIVNVLLAIFALKALDIQLQIHVLQVNITQVLNKLMKAHVKIVNKAFIVKAQGQQMDNLQLANQDIIVPLAHLI